MPGVPCRPRVLVVDDDLRERQIAVDLLSGEGFDVYAPQGGGEELVANALAMARGIRCNVAVVDLRLLHPAAVDDHSGLDLCTRLAPTKCILWTHYPQESVTEMAFREHRVFRRVRKVEDGPAALVTAVREAQDAECTPSLSATQWPAGFTPRDILLRLGLPAGESSESAVACLLCRVFPRTQKVHLETIDGSISSTGVPVSRRRTVVLKARYQLRDAVTEPMALKIAPAERIRREAESYETYVRNVVRRPTNLQATAQFWDLGGIAYSFIGGGGDRLTSFSSYYRGKQNNAIARALEQLFQETCRSWYEGLSAPRIVSVWSLYDDSLGIADRVAAHPNQEDTIAFPCTRNRLRNPMVWAPANSAASLLPKVRTCVTHGDLHSDNIFVNEHGEAWLIDFESTGPGHAMRDFVELETDIKSRLLGGTSEDCRPTYQIELALLAGDEPLAATHVQDLRHLPDKARKAVAAVCKVREIAFRLTGCEDVREYYWALLAEGLFVATNRHLPDDVRRRSLLAASLTAEKLARWKEKWPPSEWSRVLAV